MRFVATVYVQSVSCASYVRMRVGHVQCVAHYRAVDWSETHPGAEQRPGHPRRQFQPCAQGGWVLPQRQLGIPFCVYIVVSLTVVVLI